MKKGINAWCFPENYSIRKCMELAKSAGFDGIELNMSEAEEGTDNRDNFKLTVDITDEKLLYIHEMANSIGLEISSLSTNLHWRYPVTSMNETVSKRGKYIVERMIHAAAVLKLDAILVVPGIVDEQVSYKAAYKKSMEAFKELGEIAKSSGIYICLENVWNKFLLSPIEMNGFLDDIGCDFVQAYFDVGNVLQYSYPEYWIEILDSKIKRVHIKDYNTSIGNISGFTYLLQGDVNWKKVIAALKSAGYDGYITAELSPYKTAPETIAYDTAKHMDIIMNF